MENALYSLLKTAVRPLSFQLLKNGLLQELLLFQIAGNPTNPQMHGYTHETVNDSKEFVNKNGKHMNKIKGQWRHLKTGLPEFGRRKYMYSGHIAEFMWRYLYKDEDLLEVFLADMKKIYNPNSK